MTDREKRLAQGDEQIKRMEEELKKSQARSGVAREAKTRAQEELSKKVSTGKSWVELFDDLGASLQDVIIESARRVVGRNKESGS